MLELLKKNREKEMMERWNGFVWKEHDVEVYVYTSGSGISGIKGGR